MTVPPSRSEGDSGHVNDHNLIRGELLAAEAVESEVVAARGGQASLDARLDALDTTVAGKSATGHAHTSADTSDFAEAVRDTMGTALVAGSNVTITPDDNANTITIAATGGGGGVSDHGALTGLADDDHTQYALADGSRGAFAATGHNHTGVYDAAGTAAALVDDLSGVSDAATARTNLGLGGAAVLAVGTTAGTVAAGDDARFGEAATHVADATDAHDASAISVDAAGFNGNLAVTDDTVQKVAQKLDDLSVPAAGIPETIVDAKGDLIVATAADTVARLPVGGTNGHVLTVDSAEAAGVKWAAAAGGALTVYDRGTSLTTAASRLTLSGAVAQVSEPVADQVTLRVDGAFPLPAVNGYMGPLAAGNYSGASGYAQHETLKCCRIYVAAKDDGTMPSFDQARIQVDATNAGAVRFGVYSNSASGYPSTLIADWGAESTANLGFPFVYSRTISWTPSAPGYYWLAVVGQTASSQRITEGLAIPDQHLTLGSFPTMNVQVHNAAVSGALPASFVIAGATNPDRWPIVQLRRSA